MAFDGIVTRAVVQELQNIVGFKIDKVYEPDKNTIVLGLYGNGLNLSLLCCILANCCRLHLTSHTQKNPAVAPNFCMLLRKHLIGFKIKRVYTYDLERVVFIDLENNENPNKPIYKKFIVELMGKHSNIILTNENNIIIDSMRHTTVEEHSHRDIFPTARYVFPETKKYSFLDLKNFDDFYAKIESKLIDSIVPQVQNIENLDISNFELDKIISTSFNGISMSLVQNILKKVNITNISKDLLNLVYLKINDIIYSKSLEVFFTSDGTDFFIYSSSSKNENTFYINLTIDDFYFEKENSDLFKNYRNTLLNLILATLKKFEKRLTNIEQKLAECADMDKFRLYGELITSNLYRIPQKNLSNIEVENYYDNNALINIPLNNKYLPSYNAKRYFKKYSKLKNALEVVNSQKHDTIKDIDYIESVIYELESCKSLEDIEMIYQEIAENPIFSDSFNVKKYNKDKHKNRKATPLTTNKLSSFNPLKYIVDGFTILVGRNNVENDYLTCKFANKNDFWFHAKDIHGSHVVLRINSSNELVPDDVLLEAAKLAAKHSKAKNSSHVPVDFCKIAFVKKPSGSKPGFVIYRNNKTLYV